MYNPLTSQNLDLLKIVEINQYEKLGNLTSAVSALNSTKSNITSIHKMETT